VLGRDRDEEKEVDGLPTFERGDDRLTSSVGLGAEDAVRVARLGCLSASTIVVVSGVVAVGH